MVGLRVVVLVGLACSLNGLERRRNMPAENGPGSVTPHWTDIYEKPNIYPPFHAAPMPERNPDGFVGADYWSAVLANKIARHKDGVKRTIQVEAEMDKYKAQRAAQDVLRYGPYPGLGKKYPYGYENRSYDWTWRPEPNIWPEKDDAAYTQARPVNMTQLSANRTRWAAQRAHVEDVENATAARKAAAAAHVVHLKWEWGREQREIAKNPLYIPNHPNHTNATLGGYLIAQQHAYKMPAHDEDGTQVDGVYHSKDQVGNGGEAERERVAEAKRVASARASQIAAINTTYRTGV